MKVVQVGVSYPYRGGIAHYTACLHQALESCGHRPVLVSFSRLYPGFLFPGRTQYDPGGRSRAEGIRVLDSMNPATWRRAAERILQEEPDVVVLHSWNPWFAPAFTSVVKRLNRRRVPVVLVCHNLHPHEGLPGGTLLRRRLLSRVSRFIVHSGWESRRLAELRPDARMVASQHPLYEFFYREAADRESARATLGLPSHGTVILFFGYVRAYKGLDILLRSLPSVLRNHDALLLIAGEFYQPRKEYEELIATLGLQSRVVIHDEYIPDDRVALYFGAADLLVVPYRSATQSGVIPTAYAFGLPAITTSVGGLPEAVLEGETGFVVPPEDPAALADAISRYLQDGCRVPFSRAIQTFRGEFSWKRIVEGIEALAGALPSEPGTAPAEAGQEPSH